jgi:ribosomal protein S3
MRILSLITSRFSKWYFQMRYKTPEHRQFRSFITNFYDQYSTEYHFNSYRITKCRLYNYPKRILIEIHSLSPGMIIGAYGRCLDDFKAYMQKRYSKPITVKLEESNPFK